MILRRPELSRTLLKESLFADEPWASKFAGQVDAHDAPVALFELVIGGDMDLSFPGEELLARAEQLFPVLETELNENCRHCPPTTEEFRQRLSARVGDFLLPHLRQGSRARPMTFIEP
ncbi:MAG: hypothetical protein ACNA8W_10195 [Bradymonadaceae bacterium]